VLPLLLLLLLFASLSHAQLLVIQNSQCNAGTVGRECLSNPSRAFYRRTNASVDEDSAFCRVDEQLAAAYCSSSPVSGADCLTNVTRLPALAFACRNAFLFGDRCNVKLDRPNDACTDDSGLAGTCTWLCGAQACPTDVTALCRIRTNGVQQLTASCVAAVSRACANSADVECVTRAARVTSAFACKRRDTTGCFAENERCVVDGTVGYCSANLECVVSSCGALGSACRLSGLRLLGAVPADGVCAYSAASGGFTQCVPKRTPCAASGGRCFVGGFAGVCDGGLECRLSGPSCGLITPIGGFCVDNTSSLLGTCGFDQASRQSPLCRRGAERRRQGGCDSCLSAYNGCIKTQPFTCECAATALRCWRQQLTSCGVSKDFERVFGDCRAGSCSLEQCGSTGGAELSRDACHALLTAAGMTASCIAENSECGVAGDACRIDGTVGACDASLRCRRPDVACTSAASFCALNGSVGRCNSALVCVSQASECPAGARCVIESTARQLNGAARAQLAEGTCSDENVCEPRREACVAGQCYGNGRRGSCVRNEATCFTGCLLEGEVCGATSVCAFQTASAADLACVDIGRAPLEPEFDSGGLPVFGEASGNVRSVRYRDVIAAHVNNTAVGFAYRASFTRAVLFLLAPGLPLNRADHAKLRAIVNDIPAAGVGVAARFLLDKNFVASSPITAAPPTPTGVSRSPPPPPASSRSDASASQLVCLWLLFTAAAVSAVN
jgi:hypothetical protein